MSVIFLCVVRSQVEFAARADHSSRGVLPITVCLSVIVKPLQCGDPGPLGAVAPQKEILLLESCSLTHIEFSSCSVEWKAVCCQTLHTVNDHCT